jgi:hypothetical protein
MAVVVESESSFSVVSSCLLCMLPVGYSSLPTGRYGIWDGRWTQHHARRATLCNMKSLLVLSCVGYSRWLG